MGITDTYTDTVQILCPTTTTTTTNACVSYTWIIGSDTIGTYTSSGVYTFASNNANGCDETNILDLTINGTSTYTNITVCDSYTWENNSDTATYTTGGLYIDSSYNSSGCIHVDILDLFIISSILH